VITIVGSYVSPFVRMVLVCLELKQLAYRIDPIAPFYGNDEYSRLSPLRRIPILVDDRVTLCDSTVIAQYLEDRYPVRYPLYPADVADRAHAHWLEEYADTRLADVVVWGIFNKAVLDPGVWGRPRDLATIERMVQDELPGVLDYLESRSGRCARRSRSSARCWRKWARRSRRTRWARTHRVAGR
jgi:glutathione S-transferase